MRNIFKKFYRKELKKYDDIKTIVVKPNVDEQQKQMDEDKVKWLQKQKDKQLEAEAEMEADHPLKTYHLEVISGGVAIPYTIDARGYDWGTSGSTFWFYTYKLDEHGRRRQEILAHFPTHKTIIKKIELC